MTALGAAPRDRRLEQRLAALAKGNRVRRDRAALRHRIARGETSVAQVLSNVPPEALSWPVVDLLRAQRRWEHKRAGRLLARLQVGELRPVGALTERQRRVLAGMVRNGS